MKRPVVVAVSIALTLVVGVLLGLQLWQQQRAAGRTIGVWVSDADGGVLVEGIVAGQPADEAGFQAGDLIVAITGDPVEVVSDMDSAKPGLVEGRPARVEVDRAGTRHVLTVVPGIEFHWAYWILNALVTLAYLALGLLALEEGPGSIRARLLFAFSAAVALELALPLQIDVWPAWASVRELVFYGLTGLQFGLELHLASVIPRRFDWFTRSRSLPGVYYAIGIGIALFSAWAALGEEIGAWTGPWSASITGEILNAAVLPLWALAVVSILIVQWRISTSARQRFQVGLVLGGVLPWAVFTILLEVFVFFQGQMPPWIDIVQPLVLLAYPLAVFAAIFKYHLFDIEFVLKRSLIFTLVTTSLVALFLVAFTLVNELFARSTGDDGAAILAVSVGMLLLGLLFAPVRRQIQRLVDRRLFPDRLATRRRLTALAANLPTLGNLPSMGRTLVDRLCEIFDLDGATLLVADPDTGVLVTLASSVGSGSDQFGQSFLLEPDDPGVRLLRRGGRVVPAEQLATASPSLRQRLAAFNAELGVGLYSGDTLVGVLLLGPKSEEARYSSEEIELLGLFSTTVATVFQNARLFESATIEGLTSLLRREAIIAALERELQRALRYRRPLAVGMADIDRFKRINDEYGHLTGDAMLAQVASTLRGALRSSDSIGRYGGEEFLFFLPETDLEGAHRVSEKLRLAVASMEPALDGAEGETITVSIGLTTLDHDGPEEVTVTDLIAAADAGLLRAKRSGRNRVESALSLR